MKRNLFPTIPIRDVLPMGHLIVPFSIYRSIYLRTGICDIVDAKNQISIIFNHVENRLLKLIN